ncbi:Rhomboid-like protein 20, partial [Cucurbita argyrosperma subsp. argyrosperma]
MNGGPSGFNNAPVTRTFIIASALFTVFFGIQARSIKLGLSYQDLETRNWRLYSELRRIGSSRIFKAD